MNRTFNLTAKSFAAIFDTEERNFSSLVKQAIKKANFRYQIVKDKEHDQAILKTIKTLAAKKLKISGPQRWDDWEKGWRENLQEFKSRNYDLNQLIPKFVKDEYIRFQDDFINPESSTFETDFVTVMRYYLFSRYYQNISTLYEFGAGTGLNLVAASEVFSNMKLVGLDWANSSIEIIDSLKEKLNIKICGKLFNLFKPDEKYRLEENSAVLTIGTLEQMEKNFKPFIKYLLKNKPKVCIHMETLYELYDQNNLLDYLAIKYLEQRNYLRGFLPYLKNLEKEKKIKILEIRRTFGSFYHEGYTYIVWKPI